MTSEKEDTEVASEGISYQSKQISALLGLSLQLPGAAICLAFYFATASLLGRISVLEPLAGSVNLSDVVSEAILISPWCIITVLLAYNYVFRPIDRSKINNFPQIWAGILLSVCGISFLFYEIIATYFYSSEKYNAVATSASYLFLILTLLIFSRFTLVNSQTISSTVYLFFAVVPFVFIVASSFAFALSAVKNADASMASGNYQVCVLEKCNEGRVISSLTTLTAIRWRGKEYIEYVRTDEIKSIMTPISRRAKPTRD